MRFLFLIAVLSVQIFTQSHGTYHAWGNASAVPLSQNNASAGGGVPDYIITLENGRILVFYSEQYPFPAGQYRWYYIGSTDNGQTWNAPAAELIPPMSKTVVSAGSLGAVNLPSGKVIISWSAGSPKAVFSAVFDPISNTWSDTVRVSKYVERSLGYQFITADRKGRVHIAWSDGKIEQGSVQEIFYARSTDSGVSWSDQRMLSNNDGQHSSFPHGDFTGTNSDTLVFAWRDSVSTQRKWDVYIAVSTDGGENWAEARDVTPAPLMQSDPQVVVDKHGGFYLIYHQYSSDCAGGLCASVYFGYSSDAGNTWGAGFRKISPENVRSHLCNSEYDYRNDRFWAFWKDERDFDFSSGNPRADLVATCFENKGSVQSDTLEFVSEMGNAEVAFPSYSVGTGGSINAVWFADFSQTTQPRQMYFAGRDAVTGQAEETESHSGAENIPSGFALEQNYPNPFNPGTKIRFSIPKDEMVKLNVYNSIGQKVATLLDGEIPAGFHEVKFIAAELPSGIYFYEITCTNFKMTKKMVLLK